MLFRLLFLLAPLVACALADHEIVTSTASDSAVGGDVCPMRVCLTACLHSHHAELYAELQSELASWPYEWRHGLVDCADLGAAHHRRRVLWVGVRRADAAEC